MAKIGLFIWFVTGGASPSGKALDFDSSIPRFDPWRPNLKTACESGLFFALLPGPSAPTNISREIRLVARLDLCRRFA
jgi:hypothetical protein